MNPILAKRLRRFRRHRRAFWSLAGLILLYAASLVSELICNDNPLYVRFEGKSYFPFVTYYPEDVFTGSGRSTRPDYKHIRELPAFREPGNFMIFPPVPYGPNEIIEVESIEAERPVRVRLQGVLHVGSIDVRPDFTIARSRGAGFFFGNGETEVEGLVLTNAWPLGEALTGAVRQRFANRPAPRIQETVRRAAGVPARAEISLSGFTPRRREPRTVRLTLRQPLADAPPPMTLTFGENLAPSNRQTQRALEQLPAESRARLLEAVEQRLDGPIPSMPLSLEDSDYTAAFEREDIQWPFRPVRGHWLGIDAAGRDVFARILYGLRSSMTFGILMVVSAVLLGIVLGAIQGYYGGAVDILGQRFTEIWGALPFLYVMILLGHVFPSRYRFLLLLAAFGLFNWIGVSYYMRAEFLRLRKQAFVESARCLGIPSRKIMFRHILPNALVPIITLAPFSLVGAIYTLSALDYLGFGLPPPTPSWGELLSQAQDYRWAWWLIVYPFLALFVVMLLGVFVGEGVRDAFDPRQHSRME